MSQSIWCCSILVVLCSFSVYDCCPDGYIQCASQEAACSLSGSNVIAFGADGFRWSYKEIDGAFMCDNTALCDGGNVCDPVIGITKECCC